MGCPCGYLALRAVETLANNVRAYCYSLILEAPIQAQPDWRQCGDVQTDANLNSVKPKYIGKEFLLT